MRLLSALLALLLALAPGCATKLVAPEIPAAELRQEQLAQLRLALRIQLERQARVWQVGSRVRSAGAELCGAHVRHTFGFLGVHPETFDERYRPILGDLGFREGVHVWAVREDVPPVADAVAPGDRIVAIDGRRITSFDSFEEALERPFHTGRMRLAVATPSGKEREVELEGWLACDQRVAVVQGAEVNAYADGKNVFLTTGMLRFAESDAELAVVIGHEIAHNALGHTSQKRVQVLAAMLADLAIAVFTPLSSGFFRQLAALTFSQELERDADYMGVFLAARADYPVEGAPDFWRRMAVEHPGSIGKSMLASHPSSPERSLALEHAVGEIEADRRAGRPLVPRFEDDVAAPAPGP